MSNSWPTVKKLDVDTWRVDTGRRMVPRQRHIVEGVAARDALVAKLRAELTDGGKNHSFTQAQRNDASHALDLLRHANVKDSLSDAVTYFIRHKYPDGGRLSVQDLVDEFVRGKRLATRKDPTDKTLEIPRYSPIYLRSLHRYERFADALGQRWLHDLKSREIEEWLKAQPLNDYSLCQYFNYLKMLFNYAQKREYLVRDLMHGVRKPEPRKKDPGILTVEEASSLVQTAWDELDGCCFTYVILGLFAGVRPHELCRLTWGHLREDDTFVRLDASIAKTNDVRSIELPLNARIMLRAWKERVFKDDVGEPDVDPATKIVPLEYDKLRREFHRIYRRAEIKQWPKDACRHSFASYYYKATEDMGKLMSRMGHSTPKTSLKHYINLTDASWIKYFSIALPTQMPAMLKTVNAHTVEVPQNGVGKYRFDEKKLADVFHLT